MLAALAACSGTHSSESYIAHDPCAALAINVIAPTSAERDGIAGAIALWRDHGVAAFDAALDAGAATEQTLEIRFEDAAASFHGVYDPATDRVLINRDLTEPATLGIVIAHELGHVFGLAHVAAEARLSLMNPGNLITPPTEDDQRALEEMWGSCR